MHGIIKSAFSRVKIARVGVEFNALESLRDQKCAGIGILLIISRLVSNLIKGGNSDVGFI